MSARRLASAVLLLTLCAGCDLGRGRVTFRVVDAGTGRPLAGVTTMGREELISILFGQKSRELAFPPTAPDGLVRAAGLHDSWGQTFAFTKNGYLESRVSKAGDRSSRVPRMQVYPPPTDPPSDSRGEFVEPRDGVYEIKLYPAGGGGPPSSQRAP
jgi:hypothetical protein